MKIQIQRAFSPEDVGVEVDCAICGIEFERESLHIEAITDEKFEIGPVCEVCLGYFDRRQKEAAVAHSWPTRKQYVDAKRRYPKPMAESANAVPDTTGLDTSALDAFYEASWIHR